MTLFHKKGQKDNIKFLWGEKKKPKILRRNFRDGHPPCPPFPTPMLAEPPRTLQLKRGVYGRVWLKNEV